MEKQLTIEELLKPRYKVIADYPRSEFKIGQIIQFTHMRHYFMSFDENEPEIWATDFIEKEDGGSAMYYMPLFEGYPHLFKKLEWWEEREEDEMPEYVYSTTRGKYYKIKYYTMETRVAIPDYGKGRWDGFLRLQDSIPATKEEYEQYNSTHQQ